MGVVMDLEDGRAQHRSSYEWKNASVTIDDGTTSGVTTNLNTKTGFTTLFSGLVKLRAHHIKLETASGTCYFRLNKATNDIITVTSTSPYEKDMIVTAIFCSTNNVALTLTVSLN